MKRYDSTVDTLQAAINVSQSDIDKIILTEALECIKKQKDILDWAETLLCNAEAPEHCETKEWSLTIRSWRDEKNEINV